MAADVAQRMDAVSGLKWLRSKLRLRSGRTLVGIDGVDGAGKTTFADDLAAMLRESGLEVIRIQLDDYLNPQAVRYAQGRESAKGFWEDSYDYARFSDEVLEPLRNDGSGRYRTACYDLNSETPVASPYRVAPDDCVVVVDGIFIHRNELCSASGRKVWDISVWLDVPFEETYRRLSRSRGLPSDPADPGNTRYYRGQLLYLESCDPTTRADLVVDNSTPHGEVD